MSESLRSSFMAHSHAYFDFQKKRFQQVYRKIEVDFILKFLALLNMYRCFIQKQFKYTNLMRCNYFGLGATDFLKVMLAGNMFSEILPIIASYPKTY